MTHLLLLTPALSGSRAFPPPGRHIRPAIRSATLIPVSALIPAKATIPAHALHPPIKVLASVVPPISVPTQAPRGASVIASTIITMVIPARGSVGVPGSIPCRSVISYGISPPAVSPVSMAVAAGLCMLPMGMAGLP